MSRKKALLVGINAYPTAPLRGCVNDVMLMSEILVKHYGFSAKDKRVLTDAAATTANIRERLNWLVDDAQPGDVLYFHFSGHGSQVIDTDYNKEVEPDGLDEIICPVDINWRDKIIKDDELKNIFDRVPVGVSLTVVLDCCHSGTGLDQLHQYRPLGMARGEVAPEFGPDSPNRSRHLPMPADIECRGIGLDLKLTERSVQHRHESTVDDVGLLVSGCQPHQTSADAWIDNRYIGAATHAIASTLKRHKYRVSYKTLVDEMNAFMVNHRFTQRPELNGNPDLYGDLFISPKVKG
jgi:metacaspase-1